MVLALSTLFLALLLISFLGYLVIQDLALSGRLFPGVTIEGKAVGGLSRDVAARVVRDSIADPLGKPIVLVYGDDEFLLDLRGIDLSIDIDQMVNEAYLRGMDQNTLVRMLRRFFDRPVSLDVPLRLKYNDAKVKGFVAGIANALDRPPRNASLDMSSARPRISRSRQGLKVRQDDAVRAIVEAIPTSERLLQVPTDRIAPEVTESDYDYIIVVKQAEHKLILYNREEYVDDFACAVGSPQYPTPNGSFTIIKKEKDPTWYPPRWWPDRKPVPPGPGNPLGPYWMEIGNGVGIHSSYDETSLGYSVSHGCIRVSEWAAMYLFNRVRVGTPVFIYP